MSLSGVGTHGQNGVAENLIRTVVSSSRKMMLHQALHWPEYFDMWLWPFALTHAVYLWTMLPNIDNGLLLKEIYTATKLNPSVLRQEKV